MSEDEVDDYYEKRSAFTTKHQKLHSQYLNDAERNNRNPNYEPAPYITYQEYLRNFCTEVPPDKSVLYKAKLNFTDN